MIKEKTVYHSTVTGEDFMLLEDAVNAENRDNKTIITNITEFCNAYKLYNDEYGGQSITLSHLAPFVDISRQKFRKEVREEFETTDLTFDEEKINEIAEMRVKEDIKRGVQIITLV